MSESVAIRAILPADHAGWEVLWANYCAFYKEEVPTETTLLLWGRLLDPSSPVNGLAAVAPDGTLLGLCHYVLHPHTWSPALLCYLEDLFIRDDQRGRGVGRALISHLCEMAAGRGWRRVYWHTEEGNATARRLYDKVTGGRDAFVRYCVSIADPQ
jgi:GNAT superfamily N-acetyltransferase